MTNLIRPALFWVARLAIALLVIAFFYGQSRTKAWPVGNGELWLDRIAWSYFNQRWIIYSQPMWSPETEEQKLPTADDHEADIRLTEEISGELFAGPGAAIQPTQRITIPHWLIITTFALFYAVLKWVYRNREVPDE